MVLVEEWEGKKAEKGTDLLIRFIGGRLGFPMYQLMLRNENWYLDKF